MRMPVRALRAELLLSRQHERHRARLRHHISLCRNLGLGARDHRDSLAILPKPELEQQPSPWLQDSDSVSDDPLLDRYPIGPAVEGLTRLSVEQMGAIIGKPRARNIGRVADDQVDSTRQPVAV